jgi:putative ABC transport system permease protein
VLSLSWLQGLIRRRPLRLIGVAVGISVAVALFATLGLFLAHSKATMTDRAIAEVPVDWQVKVATDADPAAVLHTVSGTAGVSDALPVGYAQASGLSATTGATTQTTGAAMVLGLPDGYATAYPKELRTLIGAPTGVLIAQQTAANLHVGVGDVVTIERSGLPPVDVTIQGVTDLPAADSLFQDVGATTRAAPKAPPDNVVLLPAATWHELFDPLAASRPDLVSTQIHTRIDHNLPADPTAAYSTVTGRAKNLEANLAGAGSVGDNLAARLGAARSDALYAQVLFLFLGLPGAVLAALLTATVASAGAERRRREQALLRARGASTTQLVRMSLIEALAVGLAGAAIGLGASVLIGRSAFASTTFGTGGSTRWAWWVASALLGITVAVVAVTVPAWRDARSSTVTDARRTLHPATRPRWLRYGLDVILLAASLAVVWAAAQSGYKLVLAPEGVATVSVSYWAFLAPALLWFGAGLLTWRLTELFLRRGRGVLGWLSRPVAGSLGPTVAASMSRQRRLLARAVALVALTVTFAGSTAVFNATYRQQAEIDAVLNNGADVTVTVSPGSATGPDAGLRLESVPGVRSVEPVQHRFAFVGTDLQDLYGVRTATVAAATKLQDSYFQGGSATELVQRLGSAPDSLLVSAETVKDFQLNPGDLIRLRLQDALTKQTVDVPFHYVGVAKKFPTAPKDSFFVANDDYIAQQTHSDAIGAFLIDTGGTDQAAVADRVRALVGTDAKVTDLATSRQTVGSSLTAVDLAGLTKVELGFALVLSAAATGLVLVLGLAERRRTFAIVTALGARPRQLGGFVWSETVFVGVGGLLLGVLGGWALSRMLITVLTGVFDPAPTVLAVPWGYLGAVAATTTGAVVVAAVAVIRASRRPSMALLRDV